MGNSTAPTGARKPAAVKGAAMLGIYEISEDTLKGSFDPEGKKRPTEFKTGSGSETLVVHKRVKENKEDGRRVEPKLGRTRRCCRPSPHKPLPGFKPSRRQQLNWALSVSIISAARIGGLHDGKESDIHEGDET